MDLLKGEFEAVDATFIDEYRLLSIVEGKLVLWDFELLSRSHKLTFNLGQDIGVIGPGWVILRNYEFDGTGPFRANPKVGIVGLFHKRDNLNPNKLDLNKLNPFKPKSNRIDQRGLVILVRAFPKETNEGEVVEWKDWSRFVTVFDPPVGGNYDLYVFHTHILCLDPLTLKYYIFNFSPYTTRLKAVARGGAVPNWVKSLSEPPTLPATFSGRIEGLVNTRSCGIKPPTKYFPTENGILAVKVSPIPIDTNELD